MYQHALSINWRFQSDLQNHFTGSEFKVISSVKSDIGRIAEQVRNDGAFSMTDLIRARIMVNNHKQLNQAYKFFKLMPGVHLIRVKNYLNTQLRSITANFTYEGRIIGEIQIQLASRATIFYSGRLLAQLIRAESIAEFKRVLYLYINRLAGHQ